MPRNVPRNVAWRALLLLGAVAGVGSRASAQLPSASPRALGMGENQVALARGADAIAWNPAGLAMPDGPATSAALLPVRGTAGLHAVSLGAVAVYLDTIVPPEFHRGYLARITGAVSDRGVSGFEGSVVALQHGAFGFQLSSRGRAIQRIAPDPEVLRQFTEAGPEGRLTFQGARYDVAVLSTAGVGWGMGVPWLRGVLAFGATVTYTMGHALIVGEDHGSTLTRSPLALTIAFPVIESDTIFQRPTNKGSGAGADLGAMWAGGAWAAGLVVHNAVNTFRWDARQFIFRPGTALFTRDTAVADFDAQPLARAPADLRNRLGALGLPTSIAAGVAMRATPALTVAADLRQTIGNGFELEPRWHAGLGVEWRARPALALRAGASAVTEGVEITGGIGVTRGPLVIAVGAGAQTTHVGPAVTGLVAITLVER